jgi:phosphocarrier protein HPr
MPAQKVSISNKLGLHARPAMTFAECAGRFDSKIRVRRSDSDDSVDGKSIMQLLMLAGTKGTELVITADGADATEAVDELVRLVNAGFDDDEG